MWAEQWRRGTAAPSPSPSRPAVCGLPFVSGEGTRSPGERPEARPRSIVGVGGEPRSVCGQQRTPSPGLQQRSGLSCPGYWIGAAPPGLAADEMTVAVFFGCTFIAFGPALALFIFTIAKDPLRVIILIAGAFFWLLSLLLSSLVWFIAVKASNEKDAELQKSLIIFGVMFSVLLQEVFRFAYYKLLRKANEGLAALNEDGKSPLSVQQMAYVAGLGFGIMSGAFSVVNILAGSVGPGTVGIFRDSQYYFLTSAFMTMAIILLHTFWSVIFFDGFEKKRWFAVVSVIGTHLLVSGLTFLNPIYEGSLIPAYMIMALMATWAYFTAGGSLQNLQHFFMCKENK